MYSLLILFFISLLGIIIMIGRKLVLLKKDLVLSEEEVLVEIPHLGKVKHHTIKNIKKYGHLGVVATLRLYIQSSNFFKKKYEEIKIKTKSSIKRVHKNEEEKEISRFLKIMGDYKHRIRAIKRKIHEEEKDL